jgi:hypothetical protein
LNNGYGESSNDMPRCARCGLLEIIEKGELPVKGRIVVCFYPED